MGNIYHSVEELIGKTPLMEVEGIEKELGLAARIYVKLELFNPAGSVKDRVALSMIRDAEEKGLLAPGATIIEPTSGNTGIGLASIAAARGYRAIFIMPETMSIERRQLVKAFGAELILTEGAKGMAGSIEKANELLDKNPNYICLGQFDNEDNPRAHYETTGPEILKEVKDVSFIVAGIGSGGTIVGAGKFLKEKNKDVKVIGIEPKSSPLITENKSGPHKIQGIGANFIPKIYDKDIVDKVITVSDEDAYETVRLIANKLGILIGISSGANIFGAMKLSDENPDKIIVTVAPDGVDKYMSMGIF